MKKFDSNSFFELLVAAQSGNQLAIEELLEAYMPLIKKHSYVNGVYDEDLQQNIILNIIQSIKNFKF